jgi:hypothetical protein
MVVDEVGVMMTKLSVLCLLSIFWLEPDVVLHSSELQKRVAGVENRLEHPVSAAHSICELSSKDYTDYGLEALCLYGEDSALAGHWPLNPIVGRQIDDYTEYHYKQIGDPDGTALLIETGASGKYFDVRIARIHYCYAQRQINLCNVYHTH